jgi:hypothetical protein
MTDLQVALARVEQLLGRLSEQLGIELAIDEAATREEPSCWVFFYNSRAYIETGSFSHALAGNGPIVVDKDTGALHELVTARSVDEQLEELRGAGWAGSGHPRRPQSKHEALTRL